MWILQCQPCSAVFLILSSNTFSSKDGTHAMSGVNLFVCFDRMLEKLKLTKLTSRFLNKRHPVRVCVYMPACF